MASRLSGTSSDEDCPNTYGKREPSHVDTTSVKRSRLSSFETGGLNFTSASSIQSDSDENDADKPSFMMGNLGGGLGAHTNQIPASMLPNDFIVAGQKATTVSYSEKAEKMMAMMGYKKGTGLGKSNQGIVNPVESSKHKGRRGLGMTPQGFEQVDVEWKFELEEIVAEESIDWLPECELSPPPLEEMKHSWLLEGPKKMNIDDETKFCNPHILANVLSCKDIFDSLECEEMRKARTKSNPYETLRGGFFLNRAAMKMANMDAVADYMFTKPKDALGNSLIHPGELLYFCDICAGPGGFSEYVLWRRKSDTKGFGFTLKGAQDFKLEEFFAAPSEFFEPHYGDAEDGDVYNPQNLRSFQKFVFESTDNRGVHFVMADGGFSVEGQENLQEVLSKRLYLCQCLCALSVIREGGHFVCKLFDLFTPFSVGLVYLMYRAFRQISIFKPVTSRPANSERYIICKGKRPCAEVIHDYMFHINLQLDKYGTSSTETITECVPFDVLTEDETFFNYIMDSNNSIGRSQAIALSKIKTFAQNNDLMEERQTDMRTECLKLWNLPDNVRIAPDRSVPAHVQFPKLLGAHDMNSVDINIERAVTELVPEGLSSIRSIYNYRCMLAGSNDMPSTGADVAERWFLFGLGKSFVFKWNGNQNSNWTKESQLNIELPMSTVFEVEYVQELRGESKGQRRVTCVHVLDAMFLAGEDIRKMHFTERHERLKKFVRAITRQTRKDLAPLRVKDIYRLEELKDVFERLAMKKMKGGGNRHRLCYLGENNDFYIIPSGIYLINITQEPWSIEFSRSQRRKYFFNNTTKKSTFECPAESVACYKSCLKHRLMWSWKGVKVHESQELNTDQSKLSKDDMLGFIQQKLGGSS